MRCARSIWSMLRASMTRSVIKPSGVFSARRAGVSARFARTDRTGRSGAALGHRGVIPSAWSGVGLHGLLFVAYRRFLQDRFGSALAGEVFGEHRPQPREMVPDALFAALV